MSPLTLTHSVTIWLEQLQQSGDAEAAQKLWERYHGRLVRLARRKLGNAPRGDVDEEDVVQNAFASFFRRAELGRFPQLNDRNNLWQLLVVITERKAYDRLRKQWPDHPLPGAEDDLPSREPDPAFAEEVADQLRHLLALLPAQDLKDIALMKMEGKTNSEIAADLHKAICTVERKLQLIRDCWDAERPGRTVPPPEEVDT
jgi:RNA polymerase sigma factor (sigma-70 family)